MFLLCVGETDWKILAIDMTDPLADQMSGGYVVFCAWNEEEVLVPEALYIPHRHTGC